MGPQGLGRVEAAGQFGLGQGRVHLLVADVMHQHRRPALAAAQLRGQVVQALRHARRDRALAERALGRCFVLHLRARKITAKQDGATAQGRQGHGAD